MPNFLAIKASVKTEIKRRSELKRAQESLWYVVGKLGYAWNPKAGGGEFPGKGLTTLFHKPICDWLDYHDMKPFLAFFFARWHFKTTLVICQIIQSILKDPTTYLLYFHAVEEQAKGVVEEVGKHLMTNKWLRSLDPIGFDPQTNRPMKVLPHPMKKKFVASMSFLVNRHDGVVWRFPTLQGAGVGTEMTGMHGRRAWVDDSISAGDIMNSTLGRKAAWFEHTLLPVVDDMWIRASGTPWSEFGMYEDWCQDNDWWTFECPASTKDAYVDGKLNLRDAVDWNEQHIRLEPDWELDYPVYGTSEVRPKMKKKLRILKRQMKSNFGPQIMVTAVNPEGRPWKSEECEHFIGKKARGPLPGADGPGVLAVMSDPAPIGENVGDELKEKLRGGHEKDFWAIAVVKFRVRKEILEYILMDGSVSREWTKDQGMDEACRLMRKWRTTLCCHEAYGGLTVDYHSAMLKAARRNGVAWQDKDKDGKPMRFRNMYAKGSRNARFADLAAIARNQQFYICDETVPELFLWGPENKRHEGFIPQSRGWQPLPKGRNSLRFDDQADAVSRCTDDLWIDYAPLVEYTESVDWIAEEQMSEEYGYDRCSHIPM